MPVDGEEEPRPLSRMRRVIAERLTAKLDDEPALHVTVAVDMTRLLALRAELKAAGIEPHRDRLHARGHGADARGVPGGQLPDGRGHDVAAAEGPSRRRGLGARQASSSR